MERALGGALEELALERALGWSEAGGLETAVAGRLESVEADGLEIP